MKAIEPNRSLLLDIKAPGMQYTWSWGLYGLDEGTTRLVLRIRTRLTRPLLIPLLHIFDPGAFLMTRKHLLGLKQRAEAAVQRHDKQ